MASANSPVQYKSKDESPEMGLSHDAILMNPGPPALYQLNTARTYIDGNNKKVRQWTYGDNFKNTQNKVILMVGETGTGKTTLINTLINHLLGVKFEDQEFYQITEEEEQQDQTQSQTSEITVYKVFVEENPTSLTIIDTPGYAHTEGYEKDREVAEYLSRLFADEDGVHDIDAVCFVMKASQNRLSGKEHYIFHAVLSLFGRDIKDNIVFLLTHSDGGPPDNALNAIKKAEIPCRRGEDNEPFHFLFNNRQKVKRTEKYEQKFRSAWEMGERSISEFFTLLEEKNRKSVQMTLDVLKERRRLEACVCNLTERIIEKESKNKELTQIQEALKQNRDKIKNCENFQIEVERVSKEKVTIEKRLSNDKATCCLVCEENCHDEKDCWWVSPKELSKCDAIKNKYCTVCSSKCHYSKHVKENKKYVMKKRKVTMTFNELKQQYDCCNEKPKISFDKKIYTNTKKKHESNKKESENKMKIEEKLISDLEKIKNEKFNLLNEAYIIIIILSQIALKADSAFTLHYLDFLIPRLKEEGEHEWMKNLEDLRNAGEEKKNKGALLYVMDFSREKWNQFVSHVKPKHE
ncbi:uncharacterized protein LOC130231532 [Danio aesculapii]|uniref:uncharacterized protein LOC130231532 n=1 Tax=Danio aesculapii TaxID=1142201 RepID=UPI0024C067D8|nr:uncharacterized protein LOC130231532 [Danio aesculapii]